MTKEEKKSDELVNKRLNVLSYRDALDAAITDVGVYISYNLNNDFWQKVEQILNDKLINLTPKRLS